MTALNCSGCGKPGFKANSSSLSVQNFAKPSNIKKTLNCAGCGTGTHLGNKLNKTV